MRWLPRSVNGPLAWIAYSWMGLVLYLFLLTVLADLGRGVASIANLLPKDPERRQLLARALAGAVAGGAGLLGIGGALNVARGFDVKHVRVPLAKLPKGASGLPHRAAHRRAHRADHRARLSRRRRARVQHLAPDMVVITGDLVDGSVEHLARPGRAAARAGDPGRRLLRHRQPRVLLGRRRVDRAPDGDWHPRAAQRARDHSRRVRSRRRRRLERRAACCRTTGRTCPGALEGRDTSRPLVLLAHQPKAIAHARAARRGPAALGARARRAARARSTGSCGSTSPTSAGLHRVGDTWIYVSTGTGYWGPPMRVGAQRRGHAHRARLERRCGRRLGL